MVGMYEGKEFLVGTATVERVDEPKPGFEVIGLDRKMRRVPLKCFLLWEGTEPMDEKRQTAQKWADRFNGK